MIRTRRAAAAAVVAVVLGPLAFVLAGPPTPAGASGSDSFSARTVLPFAPTTEFASNVGATKESGEPAHAGNAGGASIWWQWTPPSDGPWTIRTRGSDFDTTLGIYVPTSSPPVVSALFEIASNDDEAAPTIRSSSVTVTLSSSQIYLIAVDGYNFGSGPSTGNIVLSVGSPDNDDFALRTALPWDSNQNWGYATGDTHGTWLEGGEPGQTGQYSLWYSLTPTKSGTMQLDATNSFYRGSAWSTSLTVYTGGSLDTLVQVAYNDGGLSSPPVVSFAATANTTYQIRFAGVFQQGPVEFTYALNPPANDNFQRAQHLQGVEGTAIAGNLLGATYEYAFQGPSSSIFYDWTAPADGTLTVSTAGSAVDTLAAIYTGSSPLDASFITYDTDSGPNGSALFAIAAAEGVTYHIGIYNEGAVDGPTRLNFQFGTKVDINLGDVSVPEGDTGITHGKLPVKLSGPSTSPVSFSWSTANDTAVAGVDYKTGHGTVTIPAGAVSAMVPVNIIGNTEPQADRTFTVEGASSLTGPARWGDDEGVVTIADDETTPGIVLGAPSVAKVKEGDTGTKTITFPVTLTKPSTETVQAKFQTTAHTASAPGDYVARTGYAIFSAGETAKQFSIVVNSDTMDEPNEAFSVDLSNAVNGTITTGSQTITITDDDPPPSVSIADTSVREKVTGTTPAQFTLTLSAPSGKPIQVHATTNNGSATAPADFTQTTRLVTFAPGATTATFTVPVIGDGTAEGAETFGVALSGAKNVTIANGTATGTISDPVPKVSIADATTVEGDSGTHTISFKVTLDTPSIGTTTVKFSTSNGTAVAPGDYIAKTGTVTFAPGVVSRTITVTVKGDAAVEPDERFTVTLSAPTGATLADAQATGTITNDD